MIEISVKIADVKTKCERCGENLFLPQKSQTEAKCPHCGAYYTVDSCKLMDATIEYKYLFSGFKCLYKNYNCDCQNTCPSADMFCKEHCTDELIKSNQDLAKSMEERAAAQYKLVEKLQESKKMWLIEELSGINESGSDEDALSEDET